MTSASFSVFTDAVQKDMQKNVIQLLYSENLEKEAIRNMLKCVTLWIELAHEAPRQMLEYKAFEKEEV